MNSNIEWALPLPTTKVSPPISFQFQPRQSFLPPKFCAIRYTVLILKRDCVVNLTTAPMLIIIITARCTVNAKLNYLQLLLDVKFIFTLLDFAKRSFMTDKDKSIATLSEQPKQQQKKEQQSVDARTIQLDILLNKPRIALLEDASVSNSRAIVLQV